MSVLNLHSDGKLVPISNLPSVITRGHLADLYFHRWEIEKKYHKIKNKMKFESVIGKSPIYKYQDIWIPIVVYNMI